MPSFVETHDVTKPAGSRDRSLGDDDIREYKRDNDERLNVDHFKPNDETGEARVGYHRQLTLLDQAGDPSAIANTGIVYTKTISSNIELCYRDAAGNVNQLTNAGFVGGFRTGDKMLSSNTNTPAGWTDESGTYNNKFVRISSGTPMSTGGADTHTHGGVTGGHALTIAEMPAHTHTYTKLIAPGAGNSGGDFSTPTLPETGSTGSGDAHTHTMASDNNVPVYVQMKMYSKN